MNNRQATNLAYKLSDRELNSHYYVNNGGSDAVPKIPREMPDEWHKEELEREQRKRRIEERKIALRIQSIYRAIGIERLKSIIGILFMVLIVAGLFMFVMARQSRIVEQNFSNTRLANEVNQLNSANSDNYEKLLSEIDLNMIEQQAYQMHGLRKPAQSQIIHMTLPEIDRVVRYNNDGTEIDFESEAETIIFDATQIEMYMKKLKLQE
ncbi:MAG TPA: hypothetical protein GXZ43_04725 [Clostridiaceae bacterium]|nr:hypothetical protein [Clostridiaceae bacterium]